MTSPRPLCSVALSLVLALLVQLSASAAAGNCRTQPLATVRTDPRQTTIIYSWTSDADFLDATEAHLIAELDKTRLTAQNEAAFCALFLEQESSSTSSDRREELEHTLRYKLNTNLMGGYGLYFAADAVESDMYGQILLAVSVPPNTTFAYYFGTDGINTTRSILTDYDGFVYNWHGDKAIVLRGHQSLLFPDGHLHVDVFDFRNRDHSLELYRHPRYLAPVFNWEEFLSSYADWASILFDVRVAVEWGPDGDVSDFVVGDLIALEWRNNCTDSSAAIASYMASTRGEFGFLMTIVTDMARGYHPGDHDPNWESHWSLYVNLYVEAKYITPTQAASLEEHDYPAMLAMVRSNYRQRGFLPVLTNMYNGIIKLTHMTPSIRTWTPASEF